ncbi:hypothetical protein [Natronorubrum sp. A-ect3]|uniref:DUF7322 domain-containing protein n=1 Tax=Natronorubrum sp. A-ect3 TaxID=3242698 RepID=UPI00359DA113
MVSDRTENEPDEYDPEAEFRDPDSDSITIPRVSTEDAGSDLRSDLRSEFEEDETVSGLSGSETDVDSDLLTQFWALVLVVNAAVLAFALGLLFFIFESEVTYSTYLVAAGLVLTGFAFHRYRVFQRTNDATAPADDDDADRPTEPME